MFLTVSNNFVLQITAPADLVVLMSAPRKEEPALTEGNKKKIHRFSQKVPIPSYLIAIAVGCLESRKIGPRTHVWSEKEYVDKAAYEFEEVKKKVKIFLY